MATYPGRKFKKVPPKGKKPLGKPIRKEPFAPTYYEPFFNEYAWEKFFDDLNVTTWPKKTYMSAVKSLDGALNARYAPDREIDIYTTKEEIEQLPGSQGAGVPVSLKEWLEHPEKVLEDTTDKWWSSVFNWEDFTQNAELRYIWKPLVDEGPTPGLNLTKPGLTGEPEGVRLIKTTFVEPISGVTKTTSYDAYGLLANDVLAWGKNQGNRSSRLRSFEAVQLDLLTILDSQLAEVNRTNGPDFWQSRARASGPDGAALVGAMDKFRETNLGLVRVTGALNLSSDKFEDISGYTPAELALLPKGSYVTDATGKITRIRSLESTKDLDITKFSQKTLDDLAISSPGSFVIDRDSITNNITKITLKGKPIFATNRSRNSIDQRALGDIFTGKIAKTPRAQVAGIVGGQLGALNPELATVATAAFSQLNPEIRPLVRRNWELLNEEKGMQDALTSAWGSSLGILRKNPDFFKDLGLDVDDAKLDSAWMQLTHYRESQSTAYDFIEAIDSKSFFKFFVATGRVIGTNVPGLSGFTKFLSPSDYAKEALKKVNYFGLTGVFGDGSAEGGARLLSRPFAAATKLIEGNPLLSKAVNIGSLGLIDTTNFAFITYKDSGKAFKVLASDFLPPTSASEFMKGIAGGLIDNTNSDWKVLNLLNTAAQAKDLAGNAVLSSAQLAGLFSGTMDLDSKKLLLEGLSIGGHLDADGEIAKIFRVFAPFKDPGFITGDQLKATLDHFAEHVAGSAEMKAILQKYGVMDAGGTFDPLKLEIFLKKITDAKLGNRYIGAITSIGQNLDRLQSRVFIFAYSKIPGLEKVVKSARGSWVKLAMMDTKLVTAKINAWLAAKGAAIVAKLGLKGALKVALKSLGTVLMGAIEAISNVAPVVGPLLTAALTWFVQKLWSKVFKKPVTTVGKTIYKVALGSWLFTDYGVLGTGENLKTCGCVGCGCVLAFFIIVPIFFMTIIGGANYKFADEGLTAVVSEEVVMTKTLIPTEVLPNTTTLVNYTITVRNIGSKNLIGVQVTDTFPSIPEVISSTCNSLAGPATIAAGASASYPCTLTVVSGTSNKFLTNSAQVTATTEGEGKSVSAVATATLKIGDPQVIAPCGWPGDANILRYPLWGGQPPIIDGCNYSGHTTRKAVDIRYVKGTTLRATIEGEAERCVYTTEEQQAPNGSYGVYVNLVGAGYTVRYGHLSAEPGDTAQGCRSIGHKSVGEVIGQSGNTGNSTGPHLHYEVMQGDKYGPTLCPETYINKTEAACGGS